MPDTLKAQHIARLTAGAVLYSDMGRILCSITADTTGWHDPIAGCSNGAMVLAKYGEARYQEFRNECHRNALDSFLVELGKWGLGPRDLVPNVNFFSKVTVDDVGGMTFVAGNSGVARRDERSDDPQHLPASARPGRKVRAEAGASFDSKSAAARA
jgi:uncharacterized protein YcgI (DUF1989 family)